MDQGMLSKVAALRDEAFATFKALDDAVVSLGGKARVSPQAASGTTNASAYADAIRERTRRLTQTSAAEMILRERGSPTTGVELMAELPSKGVTIGGENPTVNFTSSMSKSGKFRSVRRSGSYYWWFKDEPLPADWQEGPDLLHQDAGPSSVGTNQEGGDGHAATMPS